MGWTRWDAKCATGLAIFVRARTGSSWPTVEGSRTGAIDPQATQGPLGSGPRFLAKRPLGQSRPTGTPSYLWSPQFGPRIPSCRNLSHCPMDSVTAPESSWPSILRVRPAATAPNRLGYVRSRPASSAEDTLETLTARADAALYRAKHQGRNRVCVASQE